MKFRYFFTNKLDIKGNNKLNSKKNTKIKYNKIKIRGKNNYIQVLDNSVLKECNIEISGNNNNIFISSNAKVAKCRIQIMSNNSKIQFNESTNIQDSTLHLFSTNGEISIGENTTFTNVNLISEEKDNKILIGKNCMFSYGINIRNTDSHPIYNSDNELINKGEKIIIKDNVWIGMDVTILKGVTIDNGCIIGAKSLVSSNISRNNSIAIGIPAKIVKENIRWEREFNK